MRYKGNFQIGGFECFYNKRSQMIYRSASNANCHFLRKKNLSKIEEQFPTFYEAIKSKALMFYNNEIRRCINQYKIADIKQFEDRKDYRQVLTMRQDFGKDINNLVANEMYKRIGKDTNLSTEDAIQKNLWHIEKLVAENFIRTVTFLESTDRIIDEKECY